MPEVKPLFLLDKTRCRPSSTLRILRLYLYIPSVMGTFPFSLSPAGKLILKPWRLVYTCFITSLPFLLFLITVIDRNPIAFRTPFSTLIYALPTAPLSLANIGSLAATLLTRRQLQLAINRLINVEEHLRQLGAKPAWKTYIWLNIVYYIIIITFISGQRYSMRNIIIRNWLMFLGPQMNCIVFASTMEVGNVLFRILVLHSDEILRNFTAKERVLLCLCQIQDAQSDIMSSVQECFQWQTLLVTFASYLFLNANVYLCFHSKMLTVAMFTIWLTLFCLPIVILALQCEALYSKRNEFYTKLYHALKNDDSGQLISNEKLLAHMTKKKNKKFSICGFSDLDLGFLGVLCGATATFSVILLQMGTDF